MTVCTRYLIFAEVHFGGKQSPSIFVIYPRYFYLLFYISMAMFNILESHLHGAKYLVSRLVAL